MSCCVQWVPLSPLKPSSTSLLCQTRTKKNQTPQFLCCNRPPNLPPRLLHDSLNAAGFDTTLAIAAREGFCRQIERMAAATIGAETSVAVSSGNGTDLARAALYIAAEDDALVSHSSVPLPVDAFLARLDHLSMGFCSLCVPPSNSPPRIFLANLERYFYVHKGFHRTDNMSDSRALYLHSVLTCRSGSAAILSLIYSEMLKMLRACGFLDFDVEIYHPHDIFSLPRGYEKQKSKLSDQPHIITSKSLLVEILRNLKDAFWPFQYELSNSLFLRAAHAANCIYEPSIIGETYSKSYNNVSGFEVTSAKVVQHRLGRGVWTSARFGEMRRALAACERLILLINDDKELRDYAVLLYHCGFYKECWECLELYQRSRSCEQKESSSDELEHDATEKLMARVSLILGEEGWSTPSIGKSFRRNHLEPW